MHKTNQKTKNKLDSFLKILVIIMIFFFNTNNIVFGANINWFKISKTPTGVQYLDRNSLHSENNGEIEIKTKYIIIDSDTSEKLEENIYITKINCFTNKFKDISVNGKKSLNAKWEDPKGDKLLNDLITNSCKNV
tara:strand:- start:1285 stop:1689 length:405 start_codon:yes stop_codon:yes gene_type:complete